jgi:hypothetical protein
VPRQRWVLSSSSEEHDLRTDIACSRLNGCHHATTVNAERLVIVGEAGGSPTTSVSEPSTRRSVTQNTWPWPGRCVGSVSGRRVAVVADLERVTGVLRRRPVNPLRSRRRGQQPSQRDC